MQTSLAVWVAIIGLLALRRSWWQETEVAEPEEDAEREDDESLEASMEPLNEALESPEHCEEPVYEWIEPPWAANSSLVAEAVLEEEVARSALPTQRKSRRPGCQVLQGPRDPAFLKMFRPCGYWAEICSDLPLVRANVDYPGGGAGAVVPNQDYVVQFDLGLHPEVAREVMGRQFREIDSFVGSPLGGEELCLEAVVTGGAMWGDLGVSGVHAKAFNCMGSCGRGCARLLKTPNDIGALDCLKHDVCSAYKSVRRGVGALGFCHDPDCGDEAAMSIFNCWKGYRLFGAVGGSRNGPFATPHICDNTSVGCWSHGGWFAKGGCKVFQGWRKGQGIPDKRRWRR